MNFLTLENISKQYGERQLFKGLSLHVSKGDKVALIAKNGTGKTSLLRVAAGDERPEEGGKVLIHKGLRVGFLSQEPRLPAESSIIEAVFEGDSPTVRAIRRYEAAILQPDNASELDDATAAMDAAGAFDLEVRAREILSRFRLTDLHTKIKHLSGGQQKRVALCKLLIEEPEFLVLDEPTNHLDLDMVEWLEDFLSKTNVTLLLVTHDRYFLENVCNTIFELDDGILYRYKGNYSYFLEKKEERELSEASSLEKAKQLYKRELEWVRRMPQGRGTKAKSRVEGFKDIKAKAAKRTEDTAAELEINATRLGSKIIELYNVSKGYGGHTLFEGFEYKFKRMERVGIVGVNGAGKSTLLKLITGSETPDTGKVVIGDTVVFGYYTQDGMQLKQDKKVIEVVKDIAEYIPLTKGRKLTAVQLLERFLFSPEQHYQYVSTLSGGEKRRLFLLTILMLNPNILILDEPTNDLDLLTLQVLEEFLDDFPGCVVVVSHDRYFLDRIVEHLFVFEGDGKIRDYNGTYLEYRAEKDEEEKARRNAPTIAVSAAATAATQAGTLSYDERKEMNRLEKEIKKAEAERARLNDRYNQASSMTSEALVALNKEVEAVSASIEEKEFRWLELAEKA